MAGVTGEISVRASLRLSGAAIGGQAPTHSAVIEKVLQFEEGNAALGKADLLYHATRNLGASANESLDLAGSLTGPVGGAAIANAEVMAIIVKAAAANVNNVLVGPAAANGFLGPFSDASDRLKVEPGQVLVLTSLNGWPVTGGTGDLLFVGNSGALSAVDYDIIVVGRSVVG